MEKVKLGIVGAGYIAQKHLEVIDAIDEIEAVAITSRTFSKAKALARDHNIGVCANSVESMIQDVDIDALLILVSPDQMFSVVAKAIPYKLPLFIEKPAGLTPKENLELAQLSEKHGTLSMVGFNRRYYSIYHKGMAIIKEAGPLLGVAVEGHERMWRIREGGNFSEDIIKDWIFANSTHTIDLLPFFGGKPKNISSLAHGYHESRGDQFASIMEFEAGGIGQYHANWYSPGGWKTVLYGDGVTVEFKPLEQGRWTDKNFAVHEIEPDDIDKDFKPGFYAQMKSFVRLVRQGKLEWPALDLQGSYQTMLLAEKMSLNVAKKE
jgi:predicted dehydrogenase